MQKEIRARLDSLPKTEASFVEPMECLAVSKLPAGATWIWEIKLDGYRALAVKSRLPQVRLYTAEPAGFDDHLRSFKSGRREQNAALTGTICDALMARTPGELTFAINRALVGEGVAATDQEVAAAVAFAFHELKLVVEPGGAVALGALLSNKIDVRGKVVVAVLSGGNIDRALFAEVLAEADLETEA